MDSVFLKLLNMSLSATWLVGFVLLLRLTLKRAPKWVHCVLWGMVALRLVCPFSVESAVSLLPSGEVIPSEIIASGDIKVNTGFEAVDNGINSGILESYMEGVTVPVGNTDRIMTLLTFLWLVGVAVMAAYAVFSYLRLKGRVAASVETFPNVHICDYIDSPFILGVVNPRIYLPSAMSEEVVGSVLAHEQAHLRRKDHWWKPLGYLLLTIYWFNPAMWLAYILLCRDIEMACDEKVIREMDALEKKRYSEALLTCSMSRNQITVCPLAFGEVGVKERVRSVLKYRKPAVWLIAVAVFVCILAAVCFLTDPVTNTIARQFRIKDVSSVMMAAGEKVSTFIAPADAGKVKAFLNAAQIEELPISQYRGEDRGKDYSIRMSGGAGETVVYFDDDFSDVWVNDGVKPSLSYRLEDPAQARTFFEAMMGIKIPEAVSGGPDENGQFYFTATVLRSSRKSILVDPLEGCWERKSSDRIWVSLNLQTGVVPPELQAGDTVKIVYDGMIAESYPAMVNRVYHIELVDNVFSWFAASAISDAVGEYELTLFDYRTIGDTAVCGCRYGEKYAIVYRNENEVSFTWQEDLLGDPAGGVLVDTALAERGVLAVLVTNPEVWDIWRADIPHQNDTEREFLNYSIMNFPSLILTEHGENGTVLYSMQEDGTQHIFAKIE